MVRLASSILALAILTTGLGLAQSSPEAIFEAGIRAEMVDGDLAEAISIFKRVAALPSADPGLAATALLRLAGAYEKLGDPEARATYARIVNDYADQREQVEEARTRLARLVPAVAADGDDTARGPAFGRVSPDVRIPGAAVAISPDGTRVAFTDFIIGQNIGVVDLESGDWHRITDSNWTGEAGERNDNVYDQPVVWSPDGTHIAMSRSLTEGEGHFWEVGVASLDGSWETVYRGLGTGDSATGVWIADWLPDGSGFLGVLQRSDKTYTLGLFSSGEPAFTPIHSLQWGFNRYGKRPTLSPDGRFIVMEVGPNDARDIQIIAVDGGSQTAVTSHPADDSTPVWSPDGTHVAFRSRRNGTLGLWAVPVTEGRPSGEPFRIDNLADNFAPLDWLSSGLVFATLNLVRDAFTIEVDPGTGTAPGDPIQVRYPLTGRTESATYSPDGRRLAFVHARREIVVMSTDGDETRTFPPPSSKRYPASLQWLPDSRAVSFLQPDEREQPTLYRLDVDTGEVASWPAPERLAYYGQAFTWTGRGNAIYYAALPPAPTAAPGLEIRERQLDTGEERVLVSSERTRSGDGQGSRFSVFQHPAVSPDLRSIGWRNRRVDLRGVSTWVLDVDTGALRMVSDGEDPEVGASLTWSLDGRHLMWASYSADVVEGGVQQFEGLGTDRFEFFDPDPTFRNRQWNPDGRHVLFTVQSASPEVWLMRDVLPTATRRR